MPPAGRPRHDVWKCFEERQDDRGNRRGLCRGCRGDISGQVNRLERHASSCERLAELGLYCEEDSSSSAGMSSSDVPAGLDDDMDEDDDGRSSGLGPSVSAGQHKRKWCQQRLAVVKTTPEMQTKLNKQLVKAVVASNAPFQIVENYHFQKLMTMLHPGPISPNDGMPSMLMGPAGDLV